MSSQTQVLVVSIQGQEIPVAIRKNGSNEISCFWTDDDCPKEDVFAKLKTEIYGAGFVFCERGWLRSNLEKILARWKKRNRNR